MTTPPTASLTASAKATAVRRSFQRRRKAGSTLRRLGRDERGMAYVFVGFGFLALLSATMLAIDVGMFMTARAQAQNAADAGALAGAIALVFNDPDDRTPAGPAVQGALAAARANQVMGVDVSVAEDDVTFPQPDQVRVDVYRTGARSNPLATLIAAYFGIPTADVDATATAQVWPAGAATCVKPWAVPDKWLEMQDPPWDENDTFDVYEKNGKKKVANPDVYVPITGGEAYTGYDPDPTGPDYGRRMVIKPGNPNQAISASHFFPIALPPGNGAAWYEENIPGCWPGVMEIGDTIPVEPGNMTGPTTQGTQALIDKDPGAYWDGSGVVSQINPSPRIVVIPVFDPMVYEESRQHGRQDIQVANLVGFFIDNLQGNDVVGYLVPMTGLLRGNPNENAFLKAITLIK